MQEEEILTGLQQHLEKPFLILVIFALKKQEEFGMMMIWLECQEKKEFLIAFYIFLKKHKDAPGIELLINMINYGVTVKGFNPDEWVFELTDAIIGDNYPVPDRMLVHIESIVHEYLIQEFCYKKPLDW